MGRFGNEYLAESVGYASGLNNGSANGLAVGREEGYTQGWNEATIHGNQVIAERDQEIERLVSEIHKANAFIKELQNEKLRRETIERALENGLQATVQSLRIENEEMFKAFLGVVAIARPAMNAVAKLSLQERGQIFYEYGEEAVNLQTREYVAANRFPHNQPLIQQYLPMAYQVFGQTYGQLQQQEGEGVKKEVKVDAAKAAISFAKDGSIYNISNNDYYRHEE